MAELWIRVGEERVRAEALGEGRARLLAIPRGEQAALYDVVRYDPASRAPDEAGDSFALQEVVEPSGFRAYLSWAMLHRPRDFVQWRLEMERVGVVVEADAWLSGTVRTLILALPPSLSALEALVRFNRHARTVEVLCPLLAAHADDLDRAKSDLERVVALGLPDAELSYALAEAFEEQGAWDAAVTFWERLAHLLPTTVAARERLALAYAHLGVPTMAAAEFDRAADLAEEATHRQRLLAARDLMWEQSRV